MTRPLIAAFLMLLVLGVSTFAAEDVRSASVGSPAWMRELVLPGGELEAAPRVAATPIVVRVVSVSPHGSDLRYDIEWYGLEPGEFDLRDYLVRVDRTGTDDLPALDVTVTSVLGPGQVEPTPIEPGRADGGGGYTSLLWGGGVVWVLGLAMILRSRRRAAGAGATEVARPVTLAERLRPMVEQARAGTLPAERRAELERALIAFWRRQLALETTDVSAALAAMRAHDEAGPLLLALESWLHAPQPDDEVDLSALLAPYEGVQVGPSAEERLGAPSAESR